jgi:hypothetical protein
MGIESVNGIWDLNDLWPLSTDDRTTADDHHRVTKNSLKKTFPNITGTVNVLHSEINHLSGVAQNVATALSTLSSGVQVNEAAIDVLSSGLSTLSATVASLAADLDTLSQAQVNVFIATTVNGATSTPWPSGWTITRNGVGDYTFVHGRGDAFPVVSLTCNGDIYSYFDTGSANGFTIQVIDLPGKTAIDGTVYVTTRFS